MTNKGAWQRRGRRRFLLRDQRIVELDGLGGDGGPGEVVFYALAAGFAHGLGFGGIVEEAGDVGGQVF